MLSWLESNTTHMDTVLAAMTRNCRNNRMKRSLLAVIDRLLGSGHRLQLPADLFGMISAVPADRKARMHDVLTATSILVKSSEYYEPARTWIVTQGTKHEYAKVRELCGSR